MMPKCLKCGQPGVLSIPEPGANLSTGFILTCPAGHVTELHASLELYVGDILEIVLTKTAVKE